MGSRELLMEWGREVLRENGYNIGDDDVVSVELTIERDGDGCCELCYSESAAICITSGGASAYVGYLM